MNYRVKIDNRFFHVEVGDIHARPVIVVVDGITIEVWPQTEPGGAAMAKEARSQAGGEPAVSGIALTSPVLVKEICAPIPGVIISIAVQAGAEVAAGQELCVLEAMKMKNTLRSPRAGVIAKVRVSAGQTVKHNDVLLEFAD